MGEIKHTPLEVHPANENHGIYISDVAGRTVCDFYFLNKGKHDDIRRFENDEAYARLFAAAPEMKETLERIAAKAGKDTIVEVIALEALAKANGERPPLPPTARCE